MAENGSVRLTQGLSIKDTIIAPKRSSVNTVTTTIIMSFFFIFCLLILNRRNSTTNSSICICIMNTEFRIQNTIIN